jgi:hypothetical protein
LGLISGIIECTKPLKWSTLQSSKKKPANRIAAEILTQPLKPQSEAPPRQPIEARNRANTLRNSAKVEEYLIQLEKVQGFEKSWAVREQLERGQVSFNDLKRP